MKKNRPIPVFITARMGSTRLPRKHLLEIFDKPVIDYMIKRVKHSKSAGFFVLCTTNLPEDDVFEGIAQRQDIRIFRGHPTDILKRWLDAADYFGSNYFISAEADDVFCDPFFIDTIIQKLEENNFDYITCKGLPFGVTPTGISVAALRKICSLKKENDTEGQERFFTKTGLFRVHSIEITDPASINPDARMTLDYYEDFLFFKAVFTHFHGKKEFFSLQDIIQLLKEHPEIQEINNKMQAIYEKRYQERYGTIHLDKT